MGKFSLAEELFKAAQQAEKVKQVESTLEASKAVETVPTLLTETPKASPSIKGLADSVERALANHLSLPLGERASNSRNAREVISQHIGKTKDGKYHVIDWKACSWGWDLEKKSDRMVFSQLLLYKHFFAQKQNIDLKNIDTYFILLKRTAKKDNVEIFRVTSGPKRMQDSITLLKNALSNIHNKKYIKNRLNCSKCEFNNTQHCVR